MDPLTLHASLENQRNAATWYAKALDWLTVATNHGSEIVASACADFATRDQETAARLSRADRVLRGLEG